MNKNLIRLYLDKLGKKFKENLLWVCELSSDSVGTSDFRGGIVGIMEQRLEDGAEGSREEACRQIILLAEYDGRTVYELSYGKEIRIDTFGMLRDFLQGCAADISADMAVDIYFLFMQAEGKYVPREYHSLRSHMKRWRSGLEDDIKKVRDRNKERIIKLLVQKINHRYSENNPYRFSEGMTYENKARKVREWWNDYRFQLSVAIKSLTELNFFMNYRLSVETMLLLMEARKKGMPFFITPYYLSLLDIEGENFDDLAIRSYILYSENLVKAYGGIRAWEKEDAVVPGEPNAAGWLLPNHNNIHRRYPEVAIMIPDSIGRACGGLCASCQRMYDFQSKRLNFDFHLLEPKESWESKLSKLMEYFENDTQLRDILITGGDALMSMNRTLRKILEAVYKMAKNKRKANRNRNDGEKYAEIKRVRLGSRLPVYLPMRVNDELIDILRDFKRKASEEGVE